MFAGPVAAQDRRGVHVELGPSVDAWGGRWFAGTFFHLSDQWVADLGLSHSSWFPRENPAGQVAATGHVRYLIDIMRIVPSLYAGLGLGYYPGQKTSVVEIEYGISADYMFSRRLYLGLSVAGVSSFYGEEVTDDDGALQNTVTRALVLLRFQWVFGETW